jgi:PQQ enzyme repeat
MFWRDQRPRPQFVRVVRAGVSGEQCFLIRRKTTLRKKRDVMKNLSATAIAIGLGFLCVAASNRVVPAAPTGTSVNVTQHHNNPSRDGLHIDPAFTFAAAANVTRDTAFNGTIVGNVYAQPLYIEGGPNGPVVIAVTESNNVYALNAATGVIIWQRNVGTAVTSGLPCGNISPLGITGTPVVDLPSRSLFFDAEVTGAGHQIYSLNVDTGAINAGWPVTVSTALPGFDSDRSQSERAALGLVGNIVYVPYGGRFGDCGSYHGRLVGVQINNPATVMGFATTSTRAGIWGPGGVASDGTNTFVTTGNGSGGATWSGSEAVIRLQPGPVFSGSTTDYWAPTNWASLDSSDADLGGSGPILVDVPGATPSALVVALGKDGKAYLLNRSTLGGVSAPLASSSVGGTIIQAGATYRTATDTYVVLRPTTGTLTAFRITATNPPTIATGWSISSSGRSSPFVTSTDGTNNVIVWAAGSDNRLRGYNGDTGVAVYNGGGASDVMAATRSFNTGIAARGRIYYAGDNKVYAFNVGTSSTPTPTATATATATPTATSAPTATATATTTVAPTATATATSTAIATATTAPTATATATAVVTPTSTIPQPTATATSTAAATATATIPPSPTPIPTDHPSATPTVTATATASPTSSATATATIAPSPSPTASATPASQAVNLSTRMRVLTGDNVGIGGFIVTGTVPKPVLLRAIGPSLIGFGVPGALADTVMELHGPGAFATVTNDNWRDDPAQEALILSTGTQPTNDLEAAIYATLAPGNYTAIVSGKNNTSGVALIEVFDLTPSALSKLGNISTRAFVSTGDNIVIAGFILGSNNGNDRIIVRGIGPSLTALGVPNALANPTLELHNANGSLLAENNDWQDDTNQAAELSAAGLAPTNDFESGIAASLPPGLYTALLAELNGGTGVGLVEVYDRGAP